MTILRYLSIVLALVTFSVQAEPALIKNSLVELNEISYADARDLFNGIPLYDDGFNLLILVISENENESERIFVRDVLNMNYIQYRRELNIMSKVSDHLLIVKNTQEVIKYLKYEFKPSLSVLDSRTALSEGLYVLRVVK